MKHPILIATLLLGIPFSVVGNAETKTKSPFVKRAASLNQTTGVSILIVGPESVQPGTLVKLDASKSDAQSFSWRLAGGTPESYEVSDDGKKVYFADPKPGRYTFILAASKSAADVTKPPALLQAEHVVVVQQPSNPNPKPDPVNPQPDTPVDPLPVGTYGLARFTRDTALALVTADKRGLAPALAANYSVVAAQLKSGAISGKTMALTKLKEKNQAAAGTQAEIWKPVLIKIGEKLTEIERSKQLDPSNNTHLQTAFEEISLGLAAASGN